VWERGEGWEQRDIIQTRDEMMVTGTRVAGVNNVLIVNMLSRRICYCKNLLYPRFLSRATGSYRDASN
jgi:hypothetical protein